MKDIKRVYELGLPAMTAREYKIHCKRREYIKAGDTKGLETFNTKLANIETQNNKEDNIK